MKKMKKFGIFHTGGVTFLSKISKITDKHILEPLNNLHNLSNTFKHNVVFITSTSHTPHENITNNPKLSLNVWGQTLNFKQ